MNTKTITLLGLILAFTAACSSSDDQTTANSVKTNRSNIMLSADGVGPINASTPFNMHQVTLAFQDYSVTEYTQFQDGDSIPVIRVSENGKPLLLIHPDDNKENIFSIYVMSNKVGNALGHDIGTAYNKIYNYGETEPCIAGTEEFTGKVLCMAPEASNLLYVFSGNWDGPKNETPPTAILTTWELGTIIWRP